jgi:hypothetical protein
MSCPLVETSFPRASDKERNQVEGDGVSSLSPPHGRAVSYWIGAGFVIRRVFVRFRCRSTGNVIISCWASERTQGSQERSASGLGWSCHERNVRSLGQYSIFNDNFTTLDLFISNDVQAMIICRVSVWFLFTPQSRKMGGNYVLYRLERRMPPPSSIIGPRKESSQFPFLSIAICHNKIFHSLIFHHKRRSSFNCCLQATQLQSHHKIALNLQNTSGSGLNRKIDISQSDDDIIRTDHDDCSFICVLLDVVGKANTESGTIRA